MNEEITVQTVFDVPSMRVAYRWHKCAHGWQKATKWMLPLVAVVGLYQLVYSAGVDRTVGGILLGIAVFAVLVLVLERRIMEKSIRSSPACGEKIKFVFGEEGFSLKAPGLESALSWNQVFESKTTPEGALIYLQRLMFHWLPKTAFTSEADYNRFLDLLAAKTKHSKVG
ncbi:YcxB family protein [Prosthecobacter sp.]|uniref:YcxB family protein n=1 Tax=Prosthecobacter sp. TaxID=1965333 RepID=UPI002AB98FCB|nr:YcxB family protein [Prosthecobacter sp.]MDZ4402964.1 YcxB family protein [Prosthecobacter sp.]